MKNQRRLLTGTESIAFCIFVKFPWPDCSTYTCWWYTPCGVASMIWGNQKQQKRATKSRWVPIIWCQNVRDCGVGGERQMRVVEEMYYLTKAVGLMLFNLLNILIKIYYIVSFWLRTESKKNLHKTGKFSLVLRFGDQFCFCVRCYKPKKEVVIFVIVVVTMKLVVETLW